jgi:RNA polymerase sigma factor (TIGR02999 family)
MQRILVDAARSRGSQKRGGQVRRTDHTDEFNLDEIARPERDERLLAVDEALQALEKLDAHKAKVVELRFFGGLSVKETAEVLQISEQSVMRDWTFAKAGYRAKSDDDWTKVREPQ